MKNKLALFTLIVVLTLAVLSMASSAEEQGLPAGKPGGLPYVSKQKECPMNESRGMMNLGLSDEQSTEIKTIMLDFQKESLEIKHQIQIMHLELQELLLESAVDMENVNGKDNVNRILTYFGNSIHNFCRCIPYFIPFRNIRRAGRKLHRPDSRWNARQG